MGRVTYARHGPAAPATVTVRRLQRLLAEPGVTVRGIARAAGVHPATVCRLSLGQSEIVAVTTADAIAAVTAADCQRKIRTDKGPRVTVTCRGCSTRFVALPQRERGFCSRLCASRHAERTPASVCVAAVRRAAGRRRDLLSRPAYDTWRAAHPDAPCSTTIVSRLGSWRRALRAAGFDAPDYGERRTFTDRQLLDALRRAARAGATTFAAYDEWTGDGDPCAATIRVRFGSWTEALTTAGVA
jgi:hypothetical protein